MEPGNPGIHEPQTITSGPFSLADESAYRRWRNAKLAGYRHALDDLKVEVADLASPTPSELADIQERCRSSNMAIYRCAGAVAEDAATRSNLLRFVNILGLREFEGHRSAGTDGMVAIEVGEHGSKAGFIPYTTRALGWHTDGYYTYEGPQRMIRAMVLHCIRRGQTGGENALLDQDIAYIRLRDENPRHIAALMGPRAMMIPAHVEEDGQTRGDNWGPVFIVEPDTGALTMRYTARKRNIVWRDDPDTQAAVAALERVLAGDPLTTRHLFQPGEGIICNNVLHLRTAFTDAPGADKGRLLYRIRSYDRLAGTGLAAG